MQPLPAQPHWTISQKTIPSHFRILRFFSAASRLENRTFHRAATVRSPIRAQSRTFRLAIPVFRPVLKLRTAFGDCHSHLNLGVGVASNLQDDIELFTHG